MPKVLVLGGNPGDDSDLVKRMFYGKGWHVTEWSPGRGIDLVVFCGGTDVSPELYGAERDPHTQPSDFARDAKEKAAFEHFKDVPKVGICRGAQLLNVLSGGQMIQHIGYNSGDVTIFGGIGHDTATVRVDHHQGISPSDEAHGIWWFDLLDGVSACCMYSHTKSLCFQPHPEWGHEPTRELFFQLIQEHLGVS